MFNCEKIFLNLIQRHLAILYPKVNAIANSILQRTVFFSHSRRLVLSMLEDDKMEIRKLAVNKIQLLKSENQEAEPSEERYVTQSVDDDNDESKSSETGPLQLFDDFLYQNCTLMQNCMFCLSD